MSTRTLVTKRGGNMNGTFSAGSDVPVLEFRDGKIVGASSKPASSGAGGTVTLVNSGTGLTGGPIIASGTLSLANSGVIAGSYGGDTKSISMTVDSTGRVTAASDVVVRSLTTHNDTITPGNWSGNLELAIYQNHKTVTVCICDGTTLDAVNPTTVFTSNVGYCPAPLTAAGGAANFNFSLNAPSTEAGTSLRLTVNSDGSISIRKMDGSNFATGAGTSLVFTNFPMCFTYVAQ